MKNILLIATGGTIASKDNGNGLTPSIDVNVLLDYIPVIRQKCHVTGISLMNIDSSNMDTSHISSISECIMNNYNDYDGFVITHGTDTCAYTAAALSYQLINLSKPVILTGSQLPIDVEKTDAVMNLTNAFIYSCEDISGVFLAFSEKLIKGTCAKKIKTKSFDAFESINFPYIAERTGINVNTIRKYEIGIRKPKVEQLKKIADGLEISVIEFLDIEIENEADLIAMLKKISPFFKWDGLLHVLVGEKFL